MKTLRVVLAVAVALTMASVAVAGTVSGTVTYDDKVPKLKPISMDADPTCAAKHDGPVPSEVLVLGADNALANVFVQVTNPPAGDHPAPSKPVLIEQNGCVYQPHVLGVMAGQPLVFKNEDGVLHNVHGLPKVNREFNLGMPPTLKEKETTFTKPEELFPVRCDVHPWMQAYVAVMSHPFFTVTGKDGKFSIDGLPDGTYTLNAWHEKLGTRTTKITISGGKAEPVHFSFKIPKH